MANVMQLKVNGKTVTAQRPEQTLLSFLRDGLGLVGAKDGCTPAAPPDGGAYSRCGRHLQPGVPG